MSLRANVIANYGSQLYVALVGIVMVPVLLQRMGAEAYGLVGLFAMLQSWFQMLDLGFSGALAREAARVRGSTRGKAYLAALLRRIEVVFILVGAALACLAWPAAHWIGSHWLQRESLTQDAAQYAILLMLLAVELRWASGLYRGVGLGLERQVPLAALGAVIATLRFVIVVPVLGRFGSDPGVFFFYQFAVATLELMVLLIMTYRWLDQPVKGVFPPVSKSSWTSVRNFALTLALATLLWSFATQTDKLILSKLLSLADFGYFAVAATLAGAVLFAAGPVGVTVMPRLTHLEYRSEHEEMIRLYRDATQLTVAIVAPIALILALYPTQCLWFWTGQHEAVERCAGVLAPYAVGSMLMAITAFPYYLQNAKGKLGLHVLGSVLFVLCLGVLLVYATGRFAMVGAGWAWLITNAVFFVFWVPLVHARFLPGLHVQWVLEDVIMVLLPVAGVAWGLGLCWSWPQERLGVGLRLAATGVVLFVGALGATRAGRAFLSLVLHQLRRE